MIKINSLWIGKLTKLELLSLCSHLRFHEVHLWSYENYQIPAGVILENANEILPEKEIFSYQAGEGKGSVSSFSNVFRYKLLYEKKDEYWCDLDVVALKEFDNDYIVASERTKTGHSNPTTCVMKIPDFVAKYCYEKSININKNNLKWGTIGPKLLSEAVFYFDLNIVSSPDVFCPLNWFDAETNPLKNVDITNSKAIHFWQEMWRRKGLDKDKQYENCLFERLKNDILPS